MVVVVVAKVVVDAAPIVRVGVVEVVAGGGRVWSEGQFCSV
jgi:hypothetical protein